MTILAFLASISGVILGFSAFPQAIKIYKRKSVKDIAPLTYVVGEFGSIIWFLYGFELQNFSIILANIFGLATTSLILVQYYHYRKKAN